MTGHETTANTLAWALFSLSCKPEIQDRLRKEVSIAYQGNLNSITFDVLNSLPYLEAVVRETLRFHATVEIITRVAKQDDVIPLEKSYKGKDGNLSKQFR